jgi:hypothetical protein
MQLKSTLPLFRPLFFVGSVLNNNGHGHYNNGEQEDCFLFFIDLIQIDVQSLFSFNQIIDAKYNICQFINTTVENNRGSLVGSKDQS